MSFISLGVAIGNIAGAVSAGIGSLIGGTAGAALGGATAAGTAVGAGTAPLAALGLGSLGGTLAPAAAEAGSALAGTALAPAASTTALSNLGAAESAMTPAAEATATSNLQAAAGAMGPQGTTGNAAIDTAFGQAPAAAPAEPTTLTSGGMTGGGHAGDTLATNVFSKGVEGINQEIANAKTKQGETDYLNTLAAEDAAGRQAAKQLYSGSGQGLGGRGWAEGGIATIQAAKGGSVRLQNGAYVVPADVVSALGNGSSKAGAKYLTYLCRALEAGPPPKAGSLAKRRAKERHTA